MTNEIRRNVMLTAMRKANNGAEMLIVLDFLVDKFGTKPVAVVDNQPQPERVVPAKEALMPLVTPEFVNEPTLEALPF